MCTPGADEPVVTTSNRAAPPIPSIMSKHHQAVRKAILEGLPLDAATRPESELRMVMCIRWLTIGRMSCDPVAALSTLEHVATLLGIDLPPRTDGGEVTR